tara:strand:+ start:2465 stop:3076 length:612 start_codon:yes stop_codon:yes gene_type:complete
MSLVSVATLKEYLTEIGANTGSDTELQNMLNRVEAVVAEFLGFPKPSSSTTTAQLSQTTYTLYFDAPTDSDRTVLQLNVKPINSVASVHSDVLRVYGSDTALTLSNIEIDSINGRLIIKPSKPDTFYRGFRANKVVCNAGFASAPPALEHAICVLCSHLQRAKQSQGKETMALAGISVNLSSRVIPEEAKQVLWQFRMPRSIL